MRNRKSIVFILLISIVIIVLVLSYREIEFHYFIFFKSKFWGYEKGDIVYLDNLRKKYINSPQRLILINEKILEIDSTRKFLLYELGFEYIRMANLKASAKDTMQAKIFREKGLNAFDNYLSLIRPSFCEMRNIAELYYSFGDYRKSLEIYRDISGLIDVDSIKFEDTFYLSKKIENAKKFVHKETTLIKMDLGRFNYWKWDCKTK